MADGDGMTYDSDARVAVLVAILNADGPLPLSDAAARLTGALAGEGTARATLTHALYIGAVALSEDRVLSVAIRDVVR